MKFTENRMDREVPHVFLPEKEMKKFQNVRILLIDDDDVMRTYLKGRFQNDGYQLDEANNVELAETLLQKKAYDLIILDLIMSPKNGYELFDFIKEDPTLKWVPLVVLSAKKDIRDKVHCFHLGADEYITKPFVYEELEARIYSLLRRIEQFKQLAFRDPLTGLYNRGYFKQQLQVELQRSQLYHSPVSLAFIDLDYFKQINDRYGHQTGDMVLQGFAHLLEQNLPKTDLISRFGGEEFVILFSNATLELGIRRIEEIMEKVRVEPIVQYDGHDFFVTFSTGITQWQEGLTLERWISATDSAMYRAKQLGRNQIVVTNACCEEESQAESKMVSTKKTILIADDDKLIRSILISKLRDLPISLLVATDGKEALQQLQSHSVDLCILDSVMPHMDGFDLLQLIKSDPWLRNIRVLMLSGRNNEKDIVKGLSLGADEYMTKPFSLVELEIRLKRLLDIT